MTGYVYKRLLKEIETREWSSTEGQIVEFSYVKTRRESGGAKGTRSSTVHYAADIRYEYVVDGQRYESTNYDLAGPLTSGSEEKVRVLEEAYERGEMIPVYYDNGNPEEGILQAGLSEDTQVRLVFSGFLLLVAFAPIYYFGIKKNED